MGVLNTDLAAQLGAQTLGARLWRLRPGQASTRHRHRATSELYLLLEGTGRLRVGDRLLTLARSTPCWSSPAPCASVQRHRTTSCGSWWALPPSRRTPGR